MVKASPADEGAGHACVSAASLPQAKSHAEAGFDPLLNPDFSHIQSVMEEDDVDETETSFSFGELVAYHAKASEFAAILKEDSPALRLDFTFSTQHTARPSFAKDQSLVGSFLPHVNAGFTLSNRLLPPQSFATRLSSHKLLDAALLKIAASTPCLPTSTGVEKKNGKNLGNNAAVSNNGGRRAEIHHKDLVLFKPHMERGLKASRKTRASQDYVDLNDLLVRCAKAIGLNNTKTAMEILVEVKQFASPHGNGAQRVAYYFVEALNARMAGTGWQIYLGHMGVNRPSVEAILKANCMYMTDSPFAKAFRFYVNQRILDVAKEASTLHILEFQVTGCEYPSLFKALASRPGGPPQVRLIGVNVPNYSWLSKKKEIVLNMLEETGHLLAISASSYGVPFHFTAWAGNTGAFKMQDYLSANRRSEEVLVVVSRYPLCYSYEDLLNPPGKRLEILKTIQTLKPEAYIHGIATGSYSTPFFSHRFREALYQFGSHYDMLDTFVDREYPGRMVFESEVLGKAVLNIVACEDVNVVERVDKYKQWYAVTKMAGLRQIRLDKEIKGDVERILKSWHIDYMVDEDLNYLLMGWRGRMLYALATWTAGKSATEACLGALVSV